MTAYYGSEGGEGEMMGGYPLCLTIPSAENVRTNDSLTMSPEDTIRSISEAIEAAPLPIDRREQARGFLAAYATSAEFHDVREAYHAARRQEGRQARAVCFGVLYRRLRVQRGHYRPAA